MDDISSYSHKKMAEIALQLKLERAITQVIGNNPNPDVAVQHPEWVRAAQKKDYTELTKLVTQKLKKYQDDARRRRLKHAGKD